MTMLEGILMGRRGLVALAAAVVLALGAAACGSDNNDNDGGGGGSGAASADAQTRSAGGDGAGGDGADGGGSSRAEQLRADYDATIDLLYKARWEQACERFSTSFVKEMPKLLPKQARGASCVQIISAMHQNLGSQPRPWIGKVDFQGPDRAIGLSKFSEENKGIRMKFALEDGVWKIDGPAETDASTPAGGR